MPHMMCMCIMCSAQLYARIRATRLVGRDMPVDLHSLGGHANALHHAAVLVVRLLSPLQGQQVVHELSETDCQKEVLTSIIHDRASRVCLVRVRRRRSESCQFRSAISRPMKRDRCDFSVEFCGPSVIRASAPTGWVAKTEGEKRHFVTWSLDLPDDLVDKLGVPSGARATGLVVDPKPGWKRSRSASAWWGA